MCNLLDACPIQNLLELYIYGFGFTAEELTVENTVKPTKQAVALAVSADRVAFYKCNFTGYQNTLCA
ncbi:hypothetical protein CMV_001677 [Castanea mollissima]|uniref:Pectinesterase catalytic domain-containing protein n=1 Tax=Castanea mollissima TaxID=60419 RepID=A0A8J4RKH5_9ROSI|nr:hypothetical protein CMV_001677 [Castanea mollissima]